jgi:hypothetical protein
MKLMNPPPLPPFQVPEFVPEELRKRRQWIGWRAVWDPARNKYDKIPVCIRTGRSEGFLKPENHVSYEEAVEGVKRLGLSGLGFAMTQGCGLIGGDMDKCRDPKTGDILAWVLDILSWKETYFETSPSGKGARFWAKGDLLHAIKFDPVGVELYASGRFLTFTGQRIEGAPREIGEAPRTLMALMERVKAAKAAAGMAEAPEVDSEEGSAEAFKRYVYAQTPLGKINQAAMERLDEWVPTLFPTAEPYHDGFRVKSEDLGRPLEEDISFVSSGIKDFGEHDMGDARAGKRTPIDIVILWHPLISGDLHDPEIIREAAEWLAAELGIPFDLTHGAAADKQEEDEDEDEEPPEPEKPLPKLIPLRFIEGEILPPRKWIVYDGWVPARKVTLLQGDGGDGKTLLAHQLQASCATGLPWIGLPVEECVSVGVYTEDDDEDAKERQQAIDAYYGRYCPGAEKMYIFPRAGKENELVVFDRNRRPYITPIYRRVVEAVLDTSARLVVLDVAVDLYGGSEIVRPEVRALFRPLTALARRIDGAVVMTTHVSQSGIRTDGGHSGSTDWSNAARSRLYLNRPKADDGEDSDPNGRVLTRKKSNHATIGDTLKLRWRAGVLVREGVNISGAGRRSVEDVFLDILDAVTAEGQKVSPRPRAGNYAPTLFGKRPLQEREGYQRPDFERAIQRLFQARKIKIEPYGKPSDKTERIMRNA